MEFCAGGGIIDLLNKRLRDRLKEAEILNIFTDVCEAVAAMHALPRPLLHRDLKVSPLLSDWNRIVLISHRLRTSCRSPRARGLQRLGRWD